MEKIRFLKLVEIIIIAQNQIKNYGGTFGIRDLTLLSSAAAMPESSFDGKYLHESLYDKAAAYIFHITQNHPFIDGNKRTGLASGLVFLELNGIEISDPKGILYEFIIEITAGLKNKNDISAVMKELTVEL